MPRVYPERRETVSVRVTPVALQQVEGLAKAAGVKRAEMLRQLMAEGLAARLGVAVPAAPVPKPKPKLKLDALKDRIVEMERAPREIVDLRVVRDCRQHKTEVDELGGTACVLCGKTWEAGEL